jgi:2'-5' RNA ligase
VQLFAALVPPAPELDRARVVVAGVGPVAAEPTADAPAEAKHRAGGRRWFRRRPPVEEPEEPDEPMLTLVPTSAMNSTLAKFGNLSTADAIALADALTNRAQEWASPRLRLEGGFALQPDQRTSVFTGITGDLDEVRELIRGVAHVSQGLHMFVDRRIFRPEIQLATANQRTTPAYLDAVLAELETFESNQWWQSTLSLLVPTEDGPGPVPVKTFREIPLGPAVGH